MTIRQRRVLEVLAAHADDDLYGLDLVTAGVASRGSIYVELARLEDLGWITSREEPLETAVFVQRRIYRITPAGAALLLPAAKVVQ